MTTSVAAREIPINLYRPNAPLSCTLISNTRLTPEDQPDIRHLVFDCSGGDLRYLEGQSVGILAPRQEKDGKPCKLRLYSIASAHDGDAQDGKTLTLCVKRVVYTDESGAEVQGPCSNYLCDLEPGEVVQLTGPVGRTFLLPEDPHDNLIMLATGTGIAPFRGFVRQLFRPGSPFQGQARLFFGTPYSSQMLYREEFEALQAQHAGFEAVWAISREQQTADGQRMYVQHRLLEQGEALWPILSADNTTFYMCGLKGMETGINEALTELAGRHGVDWAERREELKKAKRWHVETY
jgi:ferredoxin--NADP+ reductase